MDGTHRGWVLQFALSATLTLAVCTLALADRGAALRLVPQTGHADDILTLSTSREYVLSGDSRGTLKLWGLRDGTELASLPAGAGMVVDTLISRDPDSGHVYALFSSAEHGSTRRWNINTGDIDKSFGGASASRVLALAPDGRSYFSAGGSSLVERRDTRNGRRLRSYTTLDGIVTALDVSSDGKRIAAGDAQGGVWVGESKDGKTIFREGEHQGTVTAVAFSPDGRHLLSAGYDGKVRVWDISRNKRLADFRSGKPVLDALFSRDGKYVIGGGEDETLCFWSISKNRLRFSRRLGYVIETLSLVDSGKAIAVGGRGRNLELIDLPGSRARLTRGFQKKAGVELSLSLSRDGSRAISFGGGKRLSVWDMRTGRLSRTFEAQTGKISAAVLSADGEYALVGDTRSTVQLWSIVHGESIPPNRYQGLPGPITGLAFSPDASYFAASNFDGEVAVWSMDKLKKPLWTRRYSKIPQVKFFADADELFVSAGTLLERVDTFSGKTKQRLRFPEEIRDFALLNADLVAITDVDTRLRFRNLRTGKVLHDAVRLGGYNNLVRASHDGSRVIVLSKPSPLESEPIATLRYWDARSGKELHDFGNYVDPVEDAAFIGAGEMVVTVANNRLSIWRAAAGKRVATMAASPNGESMVITPDNYFDATPEGGHELLWVARRDLKWFGVQQIPNRYRRPDLIRLRLAGGHESEPPPRKLHAPPRVEVTTPGRNSRIKDAELTIQGRALGQVPLAELNVAVNARTVTSMPLQGKSTDWSVRVPLVFGANRIHVSVVDKGGFSSIPSIVDVHSKRAFNKERKLHVLGIGINKYKNIKDWTLDYASGDAATFVESVAESMGSGFDELETSKLLDADATSANILRVFEQLTSMRPNDVAMVLMSGHGVLDRSGKFYFLGTNAPKPTSSDGTWDEDVLEKNGGVGWSRLSRVLPRLRGQVILFLDSCHSSSLTHSVDAPNDALASSLFKAGRSGMIVFSASKGRQKSQESAKYGRGLFFQAIHEVLTGKADQVDTDSNGGIEFSELVSYVQSRVEAESGGLQTPWLSFKEAYGDFPVLPKGGSE